MARELLLLRHAKSDWNQDTSDFDRPLNARGRRDADRIGRWAHAQKLKPDAVLSSPARRAAQTAEAVCIHLCVDPADITWNERIYLASLPTLLEVLASLPASAKQVVLIGHNPGLEDLLLHLAPDAEAQRHADKLLTTATLAQLRIPDKDWKPAARSATLLRFVRPRDLRD